LAWKKITNRKEKAVRRELFCYVGHLAEEMNRRLLMEQKLEQEFLFVESITIMEIRFASEKPSLTDNRLKNPSYNFDSAAGIDYTVDITRPQGEKITITSLSDGTPFNPDSTYTVAVNSYRANGGGDLLTLGAGILAQELPSRVIRATDKDLRYYLIKAVEKRRVISPRVETNWKFVPEKLASEAGDRSRHLLFGAGASRNQK